MKQKPNIENSIKIAAISSKYIGLVNKFNSARKSNNILIGAALKTVHTCLLRKAVRKLYFFCKVNPTRVINIDIAVIATPKLKELCSARRELNSSLFIKNVIFIRLSIGEISLFTSFISIVLPYP